MVHHRVLPVVAVAVTTLVCAMLACTVWGQPTRSVAQQQLTPSNVARILGKSFDDHLGFTSADGPRGVLLLLTGTRQNARGLEARAFLMTATSLLSLPGLDGPVAQGAPAVVGYVGGRYCVLLPEPEGGVAQRCLSESGASWEAAPSVPVGRAQFSGAVATTDGWVAVLATATKTATELQLVGSKNSWSEHLPEVRLHRAAQGMVSADASGIHLTVTEPIGGNRARRTLLTLHGQAWTRTALFSATGYGPTLSPAFRLGRGFVVAATDARKDPWRLLLLPSGHRRAIVLNRGRGNAQGVLTKGDPHLRVVWQENHPRTGGAFDSRILTSTLRADGTLGRRRLLWSGISIGPGSAGVFRIGHRAWAYFLRGGRRGTLVPGLVSLGSVAAKSQEADPRSATSIWSAAPEGTSAPHLR